MLYDRIPLKNTLNTRSLSNLVNKNGKRIKKDLLIRSDALHSIDEQDVAILKDKYNLKRIIDLRCENEAHSKPDIRIEGVAYYLNPILPNERLGVTRKGNDEQDFNDFIENVHRQGQKKDIEYMCKIYKEIITSNFSNKAYTKFLNLLLEDVSGATLWHCSAGKDRAGFATILVLYLLDFDLDVIIDDYLATNLYYQDKVDDLVQHYGEEYRSTLANVFGVHRKYVEVLIGSMIELYGGIDIYIEQCLGITAEKKKQFMKLYLEE